MSKLVIVGAGPFAEIAYEYFTYDSEYDVVGFSVEAAFLESDSLCGLPVVAFEELETHFPPAEHSVYVASTYTHINRLRTRLAAAAKARGYPLASYVSSRAFVWRNAVLGEHCFVFEDNTVQPFVTIGNDVTLWSGNHIGHDSVIHDHCFLASHIVVSGHCVVGAYSFIGVNATLRNGITLAPESLIGAGALIMKDTVPKGVYVPERTPLFKKKSGKPHPVGGHKDHIHLSVDALPSTKETL